MGSRWRSSPWKWRNDAVPRGRGQKAPRARRCIKTDLLGRDNIVIAVGRKHPAPEGALRLIEGQAKAEFNALPESTQHQKAH